MKKIYTKPVLMMEDFTLSQSIAHNCGENTKEMWGSVTNKSTQSCGWDLNIDSNSGSAASSNTDVVFANAGACSGDYLFTEFNGMCYNAPGGGWNIFNS